MPALIRITREHTHTLISSQTFRFLNDKTGSVHLIFEEYFNDAMGPADAKRYHERLLNADETITEVDKANASINPNMRTINHWFEKWRNLNLGPRNGTGIVEVSLHVLENFTDFCQKMTFFSL